MRAPRYVLRTLLLYRRRGQRGWNQGQTENISRSGVLFRSQELIGESTSVALRFALPVEIYGQPGALVTCHGSVVRAVPAADEGDLPVVAATIMRFRIVRRREQAPR